MGRTRVRTPIVLQMEAVECGAASLGIILGYYRKFLPLEQLRELCSVNRNGSNAANVLDAAESLGLEGAGYTYSAKEVAHQQPPFILHWGFEHFLVFEGCDEKKGEVYLNDPAVGHRTVPWEEFEGMFTGIALILRPGAAFAPSGKRDGVWKELAENLIKDKRAVLFLLGVEISLALVNLALPVISQVFFDDVASYKHREWLFDVLLGLGVGLVLRSTLVFLRSSCLLRWQGEMTVRESAAFLFRVLHLPTSFFQTRSPGEIAARVQLHESIASFVTGKLATAVLDVFLAIFYLWLLWLYSPKLTMIGVTFTAVNLSVAYMSCRWLLEQQMKLQQEAGRMYGICVAGIMSLETLKANGNEDDFFAQWAEANAGYLSMVQKQEYYSQYISFVPALLAGLNTALIMAVGGFSIMDGLMSIGIFVAFQSLMSSFQEPVGNIVNISQGIQLAQSQMMKVRDVWRYPAPEGKEFVPGALAAGAAKLSGRLELKEVNFGYAHGERPLIKRLNLVLEPGHRVAIVGRSGSGKSTLARLVAGLYEPWSGEILFDGIPAREVPPDVKAQSVAVVEQEIFLLEGTIAENIALFNPMVSRQDIVQAAKDAMIDEDISRRASGYDAPVAEGGCNFSGGQKQRLEIARALASNPSILVLDEATSALDPVTEREIMKNIRRRGCACFIVAHRLSTIRDCDEIIVLKKGRVVQRGTHEELLESGGYYSQLVQE